MNSVKNHSKKIIFSISFVAFTFSLLAQTVSDNEIKKNVGEISTPVEKLLQLKPKAFDYNMEKHKPLKFQSGRKFGFMADNMQSVFPELVTTRKSSYMFGKNVYRDVNIKTINEAGLIPVLVAAIQKQHAEIEKLKKDIAELREAQVTATN